MPTSDAENERALLVAMPLRHLASAHAAQGTQGSVVMPAGGPGALDETPLDTPVLFFAIDAGEAEVPAATWVATYAGRVGHEPEVGWPDGLPPTWLDEHPPTVDVIVTAEADQTGRDDELEDDDEEEDVEVLGPQSFFRVRALSPLPRAEWIFANELVAKQQRKGRTFLPRAPRLIVRPD